MTLRIIQNSAEEDQVCYPSYLIVISSSSTVAHKIYGVPQTINTANYVFFLAYKELFGLRGQESLESEQRLDAVVNGLRSV